MVHEAVVSHHEAAVALAEAVQKALIQRATVLPHREVVLAMQPHTVTVLAQHQAAIAEVAHTAEAVEDLAAVHHEALAAHAPTKARHLQVHDAHLVAEHEVAEARRHTAVEDLAAEAHLAVVAAVHVAEAEVVVAVS